MATYKLEVRKEFGKLQHRLWGVGDKPPGWSEPRLELRELLSDLDAALAAIHLKADDSVIFRQTGYADGRALREAVRTGTY
ncbi:MAG: hypothetical protein IT385_16585 [Deltaproteobacteria bacterium]|nr:hypothetical protein [Deltaproteobacteria bacterium]